MSSSNVVNTNDGTMHERLLSVQLLEKACEIQKRIGSQGLVACRLLGDLGYTYREAGRLADVIPVMDEANRIAENHDGKYVFLKLLC